MIEANMKCLWQKLGGIDTWILRASAPASFFRTQFNFGLACMNEVSASKPYSPLSGGAQAVCCFTQQARVSNFLLNQKLFLSCIRNASSRLDSRSADSFNYIHAGMGISVPVSALFVSEKHISVVNSSIN
jgi:hypothetical protein